MQMKLNIRCYSHTAKEQFHLMIGLIDSEKLCELRPRSASISSRQALVKASPPRSGDLFSNIYS